MYIINKFIEENKQKFSLNHNQDMQLYKSESIDLLRYADEVMEIIYSVSGNFLSVTVNPPLVPFPKVVYVVNDLGKVIKKDKEFEFAKKYFMDKLNIPYKSLNKHTNNRKGW